MSELEAPRAVIVSQGSELLTGRVIDTNAAFLAARMWEIGIEVRRISSAPDHLDELVGILRESADLAPIVVCTGGLGPTRDDLTAQAVAMAFDAPLEEYSDALEQIAQRIGRPLNGPNRKQAVLPHGVEILENRWGTAPGFALRTAESTLYFLPGVPREMRSMYDTWVAPQLAVQPGVVPPVVHRIRVFGVAESQLEARIAELDLPDVDIAFCARVSEVEIGLRFSSERLVSERDEVVRAVQDHIGRGAYGVDCGDLSELVGAQLVARGETLGLAESCTSGRVAAWVGGVPGASRYLLEGAVVYANEAKIRTCGVGADLLERDGAVSESVGRQLAEGIRDRAGATWGIGITGVAGPGGGSSEKPVGTVHIAIAGSGETEHRRWSFRGDRERVTALAAAAALWMLWGRIKEGRDRA